MQTEPEQWAVELWNRVADAADGCATQSFGDDAKAAALTIQRAFEERHQVWQLCGLLPKYVDAWNTRAVNSHHDLIEALRAWKAAQQATDDAVEHYERAIAEGWWNEPGASLHVGASDRQAEAAWAHAIALRDAILTKAEEQADG